MSDDLLEQLRHENPVPERMPALPIEPILARLDNNPGPAGQRRDTRRRDHAELASRGVDHGFGQRTTSRRRWLRVGAPVVGVAATVGVVAVVVIAAGPLHSGRRAASMPKRVAPSGRVPSPVSLLPSRGGMHGLLLGATVAGSGSTLSVSFVQCPNCGNSTPPDARELNWMATSTDGGRHWRTRRARALLLTFGLALPKSPNVWVLGYAPHAGDPGFFVSHNSGHSFSPVATRWDSNFGPVNLGNGEAWTLGNRCVHYHCHSSVLHGQAAGSRLTTTAAQPPGLRRASTTLVAAGYGERAYVAEGRGRRLYVTDDDGHSWTRASYPCPAGTIGRDLTSPGGDAVWVTCGPPSGPVTPSGKPRQRAKLPVTVRCSDDGGRTWQTTDPDFHGTAGLVAVSPEIAWADGASGVLQRTTNGGRSWLTVLRGVGPDPGIDIESSTTATVVATATTGTRAAHTRRTELVAYRTVDGGSHWTHTLIRLPTG